MSPALEAAFLRLTTIVVGAALAIVAYNFVADPTVKAASITLLLAVVAAVEEYIKTTRQQTTPTKTSTWTPPEAWTGATTVSGTAVTNAPPKEGA